MFAVVAELQPVQKPGNEIWGSYRGATFKILGELYRCILSRSLLTKCGVFA